MAARPDTNPPGQDEALERVDLFQLIGKTSKPVLACWTPTQSCGGAMGTSQPRSKV